MSEHAQEVIVIMPGTRWQDTQGTDHRLAEALAAHARILWIDPPIPVAGPAASVRPQRLRRHYLDEPVPGLTRLRFLAPPKFTHRLMQPAVRALRRRALRSALRDLQATVGGTVLLSPRDGFMPGVSGFKSLHVTDDWIAGAGLMGLDSGQIRTTLEDSLRHADIVTAVSPHLAESMSRLAGGRDVQTLPNGCSPAPALVPSVFDERTVLLGQLNERLDFDLLDELLDHGISLEVIGPRREREPAVSRRLDRLLAHPQVSWRGEVPPEAVPGLLSGASLGITPYADSEFNRASFPLKTLDYLAAGVPVVATDSPAVRWLNSPDVHIAEDRRQFVDLVRRVGSARLSDSQRESVRLQAVEHSWDARACRLLELAGGAP